MKTDAKRRMRNRAVRSALRTLIRKYRETAAAGTDPQAVETLFRQVTKRLDQAAAKRKIHPNKAARLKSRLSRLAKPQAAS